ncbi:hypothetical protein A167_00556 [Alcanivorax sp. S71-1-4]|uniref:outer membrane beta-barrel domain-containing protein n=1 Tax=Alcanivorax sp. S71-1-4 TaxID=1177159 RepID=UPI00135A6849|nr:outer membrane beta-barrel domain-containing protein [Alcanivorax sp. S71-1-4]KAF0810677.1 hypothetical protein A167_00556 [Alcanivorax sp. S71-1-4]
MANRIQCAVLSAALALTTVPALAQVPGDLSPEVTTRRVSEAQIEGSNIEIGLYGGLINIEDFGSSGLVGARLGYHLSEDVFFEAAVAQAKAGDSSFETLNPGVSLLEGDERDFRYYNFSVGYQLLPGEAFLGSRRAYNSAFYLLGGAGSTRFAGDDHFTLSLGAGYRLILADWLTLRMEMRDHLFELDITGRNKTTHNLEWTLGLGGFF